MYKIKNKKGFTLIELLVVISIIGLLSSVVLSSLNTARAKARDANRVSSLLQVRSALQLYASNNSNFSYPSSGAYTSWLDSGANDWRTLETTLRTAGVIGSLPLDPSGEYGCHGSTAPYHPIKGACPSDTYWYAYLASFNSLSISGTAGIGGTCTGKTVLFATKMESTSNPKRDCQFDPALTASYPNHMIIVVN